MTEYLTVKELSSRIKYSKQSLYNLVSRRVFEPQIHYVKPSPKKLLFKWDAIEAWLEAKSGSPAKQQNGVCNKGKLKTSTATIKTLFNHINI